VKTKKSQWLILGGGLLVFLGGFFLGKVDFHNGLEQEAQKKKGGPKK